MSWPNGYKFVNRWFVPSNCAHGAMEKLPEACRVLELGSWEGASTCYWIERLKPREIVCVDTWRGSWEHQTADAIAAQGRFAENTKRAIEKHSPETRLRAEQTSTFEALPELVARSEKFDFVYVDASHTTFHVLHDLVLSLRLLNPGGVMGIDDYAWRLETPQKLDIPKQGVDAFLACYAPFFRVERKDYQVWLTVTADYMRCQKTEDAQTQ